MATAHGWTGISARERYVYYPAGKRLLSRLPTGDRGLQRHPQRARPARRARRSSHGDSERHRSVRVPARQGARRRGPRRDRDWARSDVVIGAVGRLEQQKRFDLLLEAFAPLARVRPSLRLVIVGDGSLRGELDAQRAALGLTDSCILLGHRLDIADLHHAFDLFVQSSEYEGTPNAVLEAMAMRRRSSRPTSAARASWPKTAFTRGSSRRATCVSCRQ